MLEIKTNKKYSIFVLFHYVYSFWQSEIQFKGCKLFTTTINIDSVFFCLTGMFRKANKNARHRNKNWTEQNNNKNHVQKQNPQFAKAPVNIHFIWREWLFYCFGFVCQSDLMFICHTSNYLRKFWTSKMIKN